MRVIAIRFTEIYELGQDLLQQYSAECSIPALGETKPEWEMYELLQSAGKLHVYGAYCDKHLVGFATVLISLLPHYGVTAGIVESLFVAEDCRATGTGTELIRAIEECARENGCRAVLYSAPAGGKLERVLNADRRFTRTNAVFIKALGGVAGMAAEGERNGAVVGEYRPGAD